MEFPTYIKDSSIAHPDEQWNMHRNEYERIVLTNPIQNLGHGLHPKTGRTPIPNQIDDAGQDQDMKDGDTLVWKQGVLNHITFVRWRNMQQSMAIAIFSPTWGIFTRIPVWCNYLQVVNIVEKITKGMQIVVDQLVREGANPTSPFFECHIYEPTFESMPEKFVKCATQVKEEIVRLVRPALTHFINYKFKVRPFDVMDIKSDEEGPTIEAQWIPEAGRMIVAICRELKPDGSYGKIENLDWVDDAVIEDVTKVPRPDWVLKLERTESSFADATTAGWLWPVMQARS
jgi:hypothetical protein